MALPGTAWIAHISWVNSGESGVSTYVYFGGPFVSTPASGSLPLHGTYGPGFSSGQKNMGPTPTMGTYWVQTKHVKAGFPDSEWSPMIPLSADTLP